MLRRFLTHTRFALVLKRMLYAFRFNNAYSICFRFKNAKVGYLMYLRVLNRTFSQLSFSFKTQNLMRFLFYNVRFFLVHFHFLNAVYLMRFGF